MDIAPYLPFARSLVLLMRPLVEVVIHDLTTNTIAFIEGELSHRKVGDPSLIDIHSATLPQEIEGVVYNKIGDQGNLIRSISIPLCERGKLKMVMCINYDISLFQQMNQLTAAFLAPPAQPQPVSLFKNDWQEKLHIFIHNELKKSGLSLHHLNTKQKKELVKKLYDQQAFEEKNAADYIADVLDMGRATVFNYLRQWRNNE